MYQIEVTYNGKISYYNGYFVNEKKVFLESKEKAFVFDEEEICDEMIKTLTEEVPEMSFRKVRV